jgi:hypothetical protein
MFVVFAALIIFIIVYLFIYNLYLLFERKKKIEYFANFYKKIKCSPNKYKNKTKSLYIAPHKNKNGKYSKRHINNFDNISNFKKIFLDYDDELKIKNKYLICGDNKDKKKSRHFGFIKHDNSRDAINSKKILRKDLKKKYNIQFACPNKHKNDPILCKGSDPYIRD